MSENERLPEIMIRLSRLENDVCKFDEKFNDLVCSVNSVSLSLHELATRIDTGIKTIIIGFGIITTLSGAFWTYQNKMDDTHSQLMQETRQQVYKNTEKLREN
jgi:archaellum component FlaC